MHENQDGDRTPVIPANVIAEWQTFLSSARNRLQADALRIHVARARWRATLLRAFPAHLFLKRT